MGGPENDNFPLPYVGVDGWFEKTSNPPMRNIKMENDLKKLWTQISKMQVVPLFDRKKINVLGLKFAVQILFEL